MIVPKQIRDKWKLASEHGEIELIAQATKIHRNTIANAVNNGNCENETFEAIKKYFSDKKGKEAQLIKDTLK
ncbi:MAG: hypothetical protein V4608_10760 [Bacteroidota bacterium]